MGLVLATANCSTVAISPPRSCQSAASTSLLTVSICCASPEGPAGRGAGAACGGEPAGGELCAMTLLGTPKKTIRAKRIAGTLHADLIVKMPPIAPERTCNLSRAAVGKDVVLYLFVIQQKSRCSTGIRVSDLHILAVMMI